MVKLVRDEFGNRESYRKFVVRVSIEGCLVNCWLGKDNQTTEALGKACVFDTLLEAYNALGEWSGLTESWCLGFQVEHMGLQTLT